MNSLEEVLKDFTAEKRTEVLMRAAMTEKLVKVFESSPPSNEDIEWIKSLCVELKTRLKSLLKNRNDLNGVLDTQFDIDLIIQMFKHEAIDESDVNSIVNVVFKRLTICAAPVQDEAIEHAMNTILKETYLPRKLEKLLNISHDIISDIIKLGENLDEN